MSNGERPQATEASMPAANKIFELDGVFYRYNDAGELEEFVPETPQQQFNVAPSYQGGNVPQVPLASYTLQIQGYADLGALFNNSGLIANGLVQKQQSRPNVNPMYYDQPDTAEDTRADLTPPPAPASTAAEEQKSRPGLTPPPQLLEDDEYYYRLVDPTPTHNKPTELTNAEAESDKKRSSVLVLLGTAAVVLAAVALPFQNSNQAGAEAVTNCAVANLFESPLCVVDNFASIFKPTNYVNFSTVEKE